MLPKQIYLKCEDIMPQLSCYADGLGKDILIMIGLILLFIFTILSFVPFTDGRHASWNRIKSVNKREYRARNIVQRVGH